MYRLSQLALAIFLVTSVHAEASGISVKAWCPRNGASGVGHGATFEAAKTSAIRACVGHGGYPDCCNQFYRQI